MFAFSLPNQGRSFRHVAITFRSIVLKATNSSSKNASSISLHSYGSLHRALSLRPTFVLSSSTSSSRSAVSSSSSSSSSFAIVHSAYNSKLRYSTSRQHQQQQQSPQQHQEEQPITTPTTPIPMSWIDTNAAIPAAARPYLHLIRADKPVGTLLLMWPCFW
jgi:hypothetical protein